ncbi:MAG: hypothetical protein AAFU85_27875 [Planctomycetota bacterium]
MNQTSESLRETFLRGIESYILWNAWKALENRDDRKLTWNKIAIASDRDPGTIHKWRVGEDGRLWNMLDVLSLVCENAKDLTIAKMVMRRFEGMDVSTLYDEGFAQALLRCRGMKTGFRSTNHGLGEARDAIPTLRPLFRQARWLIARNTEERMPFLKQSIGNRVNRERIDQLDRTWGPAWIRVRAALAGIDEGRDGF